MRNPNEKHDDMSASTSSTSTTLERRLHHDAQAWMVAPPRELNGRIMEAVAEVAPGDGESPEVLPFPRARIAPRLAAAVAVIAVCLVGIRLLGWSPATNDGPAERMALVPAVDPAVDPALDATPAAEIDDDHGSLLAQLESAVLDAGQPLAERALAAWQETSLQRELVALQSDVQSIGDTLRRRVTVAGLTTFSRD